MYQHAIAGPHVHLSSMIIAARPGHTTASANRTRAQSVSGGTNGMKPHMQLMNIVPPAFSSPNGFNAYQNVAQKRWRRDRLHLDQRVNFRRDGGGFFSRAVFDGAGACNTLVVLEDVIFVSGCFFTFRTSL
uniref:Uncharacterized protein n=1 Tax=Odontella aurita TaxID=265563 RepID=A0A7S4M715_9STRA|mmetsp:Transcript_12815/g.37679  ORF Transcript_12815/g.37679 Transcript_12815/m.37679 type:complete len:131 (+) Transcript_12815:139-531(+)